MSSDELFRELKNAITMDFLRNSDDIVMLDNGTKHAYYVRGELMNQQNQFGRVQRQMKDPQSGKAITENDMLVKKTINGREIPVKELYARELAEALTKYYLKNNVPKPEIEGRVVKMLVKLGFPAPTPPEQRQTQGDDHRTAMTRRR